MKIKDLLVEDTAIKQSFVEMFTRFLPLAMEVLQIDRLPKMQFEPEIHTGDQPSFGMYVNGENTLYVALKNRHPVDILRTVAHELVHFRQDIRGELNQDSGRTGSPEENQAHELAGIIMRHFNKKYPKFLKSKPVVSETWSKKYKSSINCSNPKGFSQRAHCQGRKKNESAGDRGDIPTGPQQQLIPFPKGTTMVDVSDVYDWYKLGMVISDLDDADPKMFGQGAPHTVIAFGSEEEEHKLLPLLKRLGLSVHDIDRPEDVKQAIPAKMLAKDIAENFADGKNPQDKGDSKRYGVPTKASVSKLRKVAKQGGRKGQLAHWMANMKAGRAKKSN